MRTEMTTRDTLEAPRSTGTPIDEGDSERLDENLHFGRAWHRYRYCYRTEGRRRRGLRVLDASRGVSRSTIVAARLNPGSTVLGIDAYPANLDLARGRAEIAGVSDAVSFQAHDLDAPMPEEWGAFDFIVFRGGLSRADDPARVLANLAASLHPEGLLFCTLPSRSGQAPARALRQAVDALRPVPSGEQTNALIRERTELGLDLLGTLRPDHPIRARIAESILEGDLERFVRESLTSASEWTFDEAVGLLQGAGLRLLYAATPWRWRPDRVFAAECLDQSVCRGAQQLAPDAMGRLIDALDPSLLPGEYQLYACHAGHTPPAPTWPTARLDDPALFDRLVPHHSGLMSASSAPMPISGGRSLYRTVSGTLGELDRWSSLLLNVVDGVACCGAVEQSLASLTRAGDDGATRQQRWIDLADCGLILLEPPKSC